MGLKSYSALMAEQRAFLTLNLDTTQPIELKDFVGAFTSIGNEFDRFVAEKYPDHKSDVQFFVKEVRSGSVIAEFLAGLTVVSGVVNYLDQALILEDFVRRWGARVQALIQGRTEEMPDNKAELSDWANAVSAIARDPASSHRLEAAVFEDEKKQVRASFVFTSVEARTAQAAIEDRRRALEKPNNTQYDRVLMIFTRSDIHKAEIGKRSGERVTIPEVYDKPLALMYASEIAEGTIKTEIRDAEDNVYKKGFVVDVNVQTRNGKPIAFAVTAVHQVIDLPDDD